jgi:hypothetical protein
LTGSESITAWLYGLASYYRFKKSNGLSSGYFLDRLGKFEFRFAYHEKITNEFGTDFPVTFYRRDCNWNPKNPAYKGICEDYPFQLITGRAHYAMTMTAVCRYLAETETECMQKMNDAFTYGASRFSAGDFSVPSLQ